MILDERTGFALQARDERDNVILSVAKKLALRMTFFLPKLNYCYSSPAKLNVLIAV